MDDRLESSERYHLDLARGVTTVKRGLEEYSQLWDSLDRRLGDGNEITQAYVKEFMSRDDGVHLQDDPYDRERVELMKASFLYKRLWPPDLARALTFSTIFNSKKYRR